MMHLHIPSYNCVDSNRFVFVSVLSQYVIHSIINFSISYSETGHIGRVIQVRIPS